MVPPDPSTESRSAAFRAGSGGRSGCARGCSVTVTGVSCRRGRVPEARGAACAAADGADEAVQVRGVQHVPPLRAVPPVPGLPPPLPGGLRARLAPLGAHRRFSVPLSFSCHSRVGRGGFWKPLPLGPRVSPVPCRDLHNADATEAPLPGLHFASDCACPHFLYVLAISKVSSGQQTEC